MRILLVTAALAATVAPLPAQAVSDLGQNGLGALSIAGADPSAGEVGIAMASRFFAAPPLMVHVRAEVGAIAMMGNAPYQDAQEMLDWLEQGASPDEVLTRLRQRYPQGIGQITIVDARGRSTATTGSERLWKGHRAGANYSAAGNLLSGPQVLDAMTQAFEQSAGSGKPLAQRLLEALEAGERAGGDARGQASATLVVKKKRPGGVSPGNVDDYVNLRIDHSSGAIRELRTLYTAWEWITGPLQPGARVMEQSRGLDVAWVQESLSRLGYLLRATREVFGENGEPSGVLDARTAASIARYKRDHMMGGGPTVGLQMINFLMREQAGLLPQPVTMDDTDHMVIYHRYGGDVRKPAP